jgi:hypothetical protein
VGSTIFNSEIAFRIGAEIPKSELFWHFGCIFIKIVVLYARILALMNGHPVVVVFTTTDTVYSRIAPYLFIIGFIHDFLDTSSRSLMSF